MIEKITVRIFLICLISCAGMILFGIWANQKPPEVYFKTAATFFITGLTSFLLWFVSFAYSLYLTVRELHAGR